MGARGPAPTPTAILKARGSWRADTVTDEPQAPRGRPYKPAWLKAPAARHWKPLLNQIEKMGILSECDGNALGRYCMNLELWLRAHKFLDTWQEPLGIAIPVKNDSGTLIDMKLLPQTKLLAALDAELARTEQQFGLTPSARRQLGRQRDTQSKQAGDSAGESVRAKLFA